MSRLVLYLLIFALGLTDQAAFPQRLIIKFNSDSETWRQVRSLMAGRNELVFSPAAAKKRGLPLPAFFNRYPFSSIRPLKSDLPAQPLPGGVERLFVAEIPESWNLTKTLRRLSADTAIEYAEFDASGYGAGRPARHGNTPSPLLLSSPDLLPNDPNFALQWGLLNTGQRIGGSTGKQGADIQAPAAWDITTGSPDIILAVLDSGVPATAAEFAGRRLRGYDYVNNDDDPTDDHGHGSNVASIAAATGNNGIAIAGVNWRCRLLPFKVLNKDNWGYYSWWIAALVAAADSGARVINMSLGGTDYSRALEDAVTYAMARGAVVVASMMNTNDDTRFYPAAFDPVIAVGATNNHDQRAVPFCWGGGGSNFGNHIDFVAPGEMILGIHFQQPNLTTYWCGTSQAAPMVSGVISLLLGLKPDLTYAQIYQALQAGARDQIGPGSEDRPGWDPYFGWGRIDAFATLKAVVTGISQQTRLPRPSRFRLFQNYPNPFNPETSIAFELSRRAHVKLVIYNLAGQEVQVLVDAVKQAGRHQVRWNAAASPRAASGLYFYEFIVDGRPIVKKKMLLIR